MGRDDAIAATRPDHRYLIDGLLAARAVLHDHAAKRLVGKDAREIVDAAVAFGLANHRDNLVGLHLSRKDAFFEAGGIRHTLDFDLRNFDSHFLNLP